MLLRLLTFFVHSLLRLRYRIEVKGLKGLEVKGRKSILFMPNHPALIDPVIVSVLLMKTFRPRPLVDEKQVRNSLLKYVKNIVRVLSLPDIGVLGSAVKGQVLEQLNNCVEALKAGDNLLLYPAGRLYRSRYEKLRANGGVERILKQAPETRIILVRTTGLWGSSFSRSHGFQPTFGEALWPHLKHLLANLIFFTPRRHVTVEFFEEPSDFPRAQGKEVMNRYLEKFYNVASRPNTYVPYYWWERGGTRTIPEPETIQSNLDTRQVPEKVRKKVYAKLHEYTSRPVIADTNTLGTDLSMDSLMTAEIATWVQEEFGYPVPNPEMMRTVAHVLLAAIGQSAGLEPLKEVPERWFVERDEKTLAVPEGDCMGELFIRNVEARPDYPIIADQMKGVMTYKEMILPILVLKKLIEKIPDERVGLIMPACMSANIVYMAMIYAGKIPVMVNWTVGLRNMRHSLESVGVRHILTAQAVITKLEEKGTDFGEIKNSFLYLEEMVKKASLFTKLGAVLTAKTCWASALRKCKVNKTCAILFTSGSENLPKAVPLSHRNVLVDIRTALGDIKLDGDTTVIGMLPPFHSFGLMVTVILPNCGGMRVVYHANPTEGDMIARLIHAYKATLIIGTPTFTHNILRNAPHKQVESIRCVITGAEKCPQQTYDLVQERCPEARINEGYGITECAPIVCLNIPGATVLGSLGRVLPCMEWTIRDEEMNPVPVGEKGMLYVRGDNVFSGYINFDGPSPFVDIDGKEFYRTGDLVKADENGFIFFQGRLKRFVKIAGEMVSLPAIEDVLLEAYRKPDSELPLAVEAVGPEEKPDITLFTTLDLTQDEVNETILKAGLTPIYTVKKVVKIDAVPLLGTGKTDYRTLKTMGAPKQEEN